MTGEYLQKNLWFQENPLALRHIGTSNVPPWKHPCETLGGHHHCPGPLAPGQVVGTRFPNGLVRENLDRKWFETSGGWNCRDPTCLRPNVSGLTFKGTATVLETMVLTIKCKEFDGFLWFFPWFSEVFYGFSMVFYQNFLGFPYVPICSHHPMLGRPLHLGRLVGKCLRKSTPEMLNLADQFWTHVPMNRFREKNLQGNSIFFSMFSLSHAGKSYTHTYIYITIDRQI